jgi:hypothetical protein
MHACLGFFKWSHKGNIYYYIEYCIADFMTNIGNNVQYTSETALLKAKYFQVAGADGLCF